MRETLTYLAAALLAVLALALAVPPFIDWSAWGPRLGTTLGDALHADVRLGGPIAVRMLPSPRFEVGALRIARPGLDLEADGAALELALAPLLRGVVSIASARLERPRVMVDPAAASGVDLPAEIGVNRLFLRDATLALKTPGGTRRLEHVDLIASADSALGPFKAEGFLRASSRLLPFKLATGAIANGRLAVKAEIDPLAGLPKGEATGALVWDGRGPRFDGTATLSGSLQGVATDGGAVPWRARLDGTATPDEAQATALELRLGDDAARLVANGTGRFDAGKLALTLQSERPDFDRFRAAYDVAKIAREISANASPAALSVDWTTAAAMLGDTVATDLRLTASRAANDPPGRIGIDAAAKLSRSGAVSFAGTVDTTPHLVGDLALRSDDASSLMKWIGTLAPSTALPADVPFEHIEIGGRIDANARRMEAHDLSAVFDRSVVTGNATLTPNAGGVPRIEAALEAQALDLDALPDFSKLRSTMGGVDFALTFNARAIRVARVGAAPVDAGLIDVALARNGGVLTLDRLTLQNLAGATAKASGRVTSKDAHVEGLLDARQLGDFAALLNRVAPSPAAELLMSRARILSPATFALAFDAKAVNEVFAPTSLTLDGKAADTSVRAALTPVTGQLNAISGTITIDAPEAAPFLRQLGVPVIPLRGQGSAQVEAKLSGNIGASVSVAATSNIAGATLTFDGRARFDSQARETDGELSLSARDLGPLLRIIAAPVDTFVRWPADMKARLVMQPARTSLSDIAGQVAGTNVSGRLSREGDAKIEGALRLSRLDLPSLAAVLLGSPQPAPAGKIFASSKWATQPNDPPSATIDLVADTLDIGGIAATDARGRISIAPGEIVVSDSVMKLAGGEMTGAVTLRRREDTASLTATLAANDTALSLPWFSARLLGRAKLSGAGTSAAGLVGSLAGNGTLRLADARLERADLDAVARVAQAVDAEQIELAPPAILSALSRAFDAAPQILPPLEQEVSIAAGQVLLTPIDLALGTGSATLDARYDLASDRIVLHEVLRPAPPKFWRGVPPAVALNYGGPRDAPLRTIDAAELIGTLAEHGLTRANERIAALEADQRERTFFNRRLKFDRALDAARKAEEAALEATRKEAERQEALRQERERRAAERALQAPAATVPLDSRPLDLRPPAARSGGANVPGIIAPDPGTSGRY